MTGARGSHSPNGVGSQLGLPGPVPVERWRAKLALQKGWWLTERGDAHRRAARPWTPSPEVAAAYLGLGTVHAGGGRLLDLGCGDGRRAAHFPRMQYVGLDPLHLAADRAGGVTVGIGEHIPFADHTFGAVLCVEVLDHVIDPARCLLEAFRVTAPGGSIFVFGVVPEADRSSEHLGRFELTEADVHLHAIAPAFVHSCLEDAYAEVESRVDSGYFSSWGRGRLDRMRRPPRDRTRT